MTACIPVGSSGMSIAPLLASPIITRVLRPETGDLVDLDLFGDFLEPGRSKALEPEKAFNQSVRGPADHRLGVARVPHCGRAGAAVMRDKRSDEGIPRQSRLVGDP